MKSILLIGLGRFGYHIAEQLNQMGHETMAIDKNERRIDDILPLVTNAQIGDATDPKFLHSLDVENYDVCIVAIANDFQSSLEITYLLKEAGAKMVVSRAEQDMQVKFLLRNGADQVVYPEKQVARWAAIRYTSNHIMDYIEVDDEHAIFEVPVPKKWIGLTVGQIDVRRKYGINIMALRNKKHPGETDVIISPDTVLTADHTMLVIGAYDNLKKYFHI